ncbi:sensor histidine kinase [Lacrimispora sphenoides]|uniref:Two-component system, AgrA family, sensor histidine kinase AgrC n=1 Tax=Lacrimispora sphenoides JCM 1415 TaxID=1297793 RepID=A0ABY1C625_9FIRM|nr:sensor histidine kinase [Lacrimispora sphenoides]SET72647.1 two-component system, AgrA family, sensor histidine kinase AgrC [[Clostridium] sphenoides JCM 1415]SUY50791.1 signal transduction protein with a C-terminal ATPase domain [Lacrimispora sphenoides]
MTYFIYSLTGSLCSYFSCVHLLPNKFSPAKKSIIFLYTFATVYFFNKSFGQISTLVTYGGILLITFYFSKFNFFSLSCNLFGYLYSVTFNYIFMWLAGTLLKMDMLELLAHSGLTIAFSCIYCLFCGSTTKMLGWYLHSKLNIAKYLTNQHLLKAIFLDLFLLVFFYIFNFSYGERLGYNYGVIAANGIIFLLLFAITVLLMYSVYKITMSEQAYKHRMAQFENLRTYTDRLENSYGVMRKFKHDYMNILITMSGFIKENDMNGLKDYYEDRILPISRAFTESDTKLGALSNIKNTALKSLLSSKFVYMMEVGIKTEIELTEPIDDLNMDCLDLSRILGIFLDNAMEAAIETKEKGVRFCMFYKEKDLHLIIQNTALPPTFAISELRSHEISTKGENRGIGLFNVDMILKNYENTIWNTTYEEPNFTQELILMRNN